MLVLEMGFGKLIKMVRIGVEFLIMRLFVKNVIFFVFVGVMLVFCSVVLGGLSYFCLLIDVDMVVFFVVVDWIEFVGECWCCCMVWVVNCDF